MAKQASIAKRQIAAHRPHAELHAAYGFLNP
jgi:hypothetical protein